MIKYLRDLTPNRAVFLLIYFCLSGFYLQKIYFQDLNGFIFNTAGPIFLGLATLAGLSFTFASVVKSKEAKSTSIFTGEKLFHASAHILLATILGICAIELPIRPLPALYLLISPWQIFLIILLFLYFQRLLKIFLHFLNFLFSFNHQIHSMYIIRFVKYKLLHICCIFE